ncbi:class I SAM-dependent methyltransferase [Streptomyces sp. CA-181903]|uniref:class I SAM-dependent methyltransferase n=1 Tax=Streptomyces sp. CA-181903 TaxID=3240055 RepID=UPI003D8B93FC
MEKDDEATRCNRLNWDERASIHGQDRYYDTAGFLAGGSSLREAELSLVGNVEGRKLLHLQCHTGLDTLSWARRGAEVTGLDFSPVAVRRARELAERAGLDADFVEGDARRLPPELRGRFDVVVATYGVFAWIDDVAAWAGSAAAALRPGGRLVVVDLHPLAQMIDRGDPLVVDASYANTGPQRFRSETSYADPSTPLRHQETVQWSHSLGEIVSAVAGAGLRVEVLDEYLSSDRDDRGSVLRQGQDGRWRLRIWPHDLPVLFGLAAVKPV